MASIIPSKTGGYMKKITFLLTLGLMLSVFSLSMAAEKPRLGVLRFTNNTSAGWWSGSTGSELQDMLAAELTSIGAFQVLERKEIDAVLGEQDLGASGRIDSKTKAKIGKIKGAKYLVAGTVSSFQEQTSGSGGGISVMGFSVGGKSDKAYMAVDLKVIDTTTGEIVDARTVEASSSSSGLTLGASVRGVSGNLGQYEKTPTGKAIRACVMEIAEYLECSLIKGKDDSCMSEYAAKEAARRDKTKKSIELQ
jgi:curli biogenesis system outer membrane secretion channel CsgG